MHKDDGRLNRTAGFLTVRPDGVEIVNVSSPTVHGGECGRTEGRMCCPFVEGFLASLSLRIAASSLTRKSGHTTSRGILAESTAADVRLVLYRSFEQGAKL